MTFQEYLNQDPPKRRHFVTVTGWDIDHYWIFGDSAIIHLTVHGEMFQYRLDKGSIGLWTMDEHGNKKSDSCFIFPDFVWKAPTRVPSKYE